MKYCSTGVRATALVALAVFAAACGGGGSGSADREPPATGGTTSAPGRASGGSPTGKQSGSGKESGSGGEESGNGGSGFATVFDTEARFVQAFPAPSAMAGWTPDGGSVDLDEAPAGPAECLPAAEKHWDCLATADGKAEYEAFGEEVDFELYAYPDRKTAQAACRHEKAWSKGYAKAQVGAVPGAEGHAYYRNVGGEDGLYVALCLGTVIAEVTLAGPNGDLDPKSAHIFSRMFVENIRKAAAAP
ncbi:hypothetical protein [Streptomyces tritici]|uniref:hypothetical protein n=1 Tax=Streptomyces tritici TaxID=2054410 RepID=UPI003AF09BCF